MARILVVDDDPDILKVAEAVLVSAGHTVYLAEDALRAIDWLNQISFDLLLSDANMPHYSGFELVSTIRNDDRFKDMSIAMLTGLRERKDVERGIKAGVDDYIVKPLDPLILVQKVNALFDKKPPQNHPEIQLGQTPLAQGIINRPIRIESVSELGVTIVCDVPMTAGMIIDLNGEFFKALDEEPPPMKVLHVTLDQTSTQYRAQLIFLGAREGFLQKIRRWLYSHGASQTKTAA